MFMLSEYIDLLFQLATEEIGSYNSISERPYRDNAADTIHYDDKSVDNRWSPIYCSLHYETTSIQ